MRKVSVFIIVSILIVGVFAACNSGDEKGKSTKTLPQSRGEAGEIILVMDSIQWHGELGLKLRQVMLEEIQGLPQPEAWFTLRRVSPLKLNDFLRMTSNMVIVHTLDNKTREGNAIKKFFTENSLNTIKENDRLFSFAQQEVYARGQEVLYLFGQTEESLISQLDKNAATVKNHFNEIENTRLRKAMSKNPEKGLTNLLESTTGTSMLIPFGYELSHQASQFVWFRQLDREREKNIWISWKPYESQAEFDQVNLLSVRDSLAKKNIFDVEKPEIYLSSQNQEPLYHEYIDFNGNYGVEIRGLWKYSDFSRGGAFLGYLFVHEKSNRLYYIEGFLDAPGKNKREGIREMEVILKTFRVLEK